MNLSNSGMQPKQQQTSISGTGSSDEQFGLSTDGEMMKVDSLICITDSDSGEDADEEDNITALNDSTVPCKQPEQLNLGYSQEPDTAFLSDSDVEMIISFSQPEINLDFSSDSESGKPTTNMAGFVKQEKVDLPVAFEDINNDLFENFSSAEDQFDQGSDFEPASLVQCLEKKQKDNSDTLSLSDEDIFKSQPEYDNKDSFGKTKHDTIYLGTRSNGKENKEQDDFGISFKKDDAYQTISKNKEYEFSSCGEKILKNSVMVLESTNKLENENNISDKQFVDYSDDDFTLINLNDSDNLDAYEVEKPVLNCKPNEYTFAVNKDRGYYRNGDVTSGTCEESQLEIEDKTTVTSNVSSAEKKVDQEIFCDSQFHLYFGQNQIGEASKKRLSDSLGICFKEFSSDSFSDCDFEMQDGLAIKGTDKPLLDTKITCLNNQQKIIIEREPEKPKGIMSSYEAVNQISLSRKNDSEYIELTQVKERDIANEGSNNAYLSETQVDRHDELHFDHATLSDQETYYDASSQVFSAEETNGAYRNATQIDIDYSTDATSGVTTQRDLDGTTYDDPMQVDIDYSTDATSGVTTQIDIDYSTDATSDANTWRTCHTLKRPHSKKMSIVSPCSAEVDDDQVTFKKPRLALPESKYIQTEALSPQCTLEMPASSIVDKNNMFQKLNNDPITPSCMDQTMFTNNDMWLSKSPKELHLLSDATDVYKIRKRARSKKDEGRCLNAQIQASKSQLRTRAMQLAVHPEITTGHSKKQVIVQPSDISDVDMPTNSQIVSKGLPILNPTSLLLKLPAPATGQFTSRSASFPDTHSKTLLNATTTLVLMTTSSVTTATTSISMATATSTTSVSFARPTAVTIMPPLDTTMNKSYRGLKSSGLSPEVTAKDKFNKTTKEKHSNNKRSDSSERSQSHSSRSFPNIENSSKYSYIKRNKDQKSNSHEKDKKIKIYKNKTLSFGDVSTIASTTNIGAVTSSSDVITVTSSKYSHSSRIRKKDTNSSGSEKERKRNKDKNKSSLSGHVGIVTNTGHVGIVTNLSAESISVKVACQSNEKHSCVTTVLKNSALATQTSASNVVRIASASTSGTSASKKRLLSATGTCVASSVSSMPLTLASITSPMASMPRTVTSVMPIVAIVTSSVAGVTTRIPTTNVQSATRTKDTSVTLPDKSLTKKTLQRHHSHSNTCLQSPALLKLFSASSTRVKSADLLQKQHSYVESDYKTINTFSSGSRDLSGKRASLQQQHSSNSLASKLPSNMINTNELLQWDDFLRVILKWNPDWFEEREKAHNYNKYIGRPPVTNDLWGRDKHTLYPLVRRYETFKEYSEKFMLPLLLYETWESCYKDWREKKKRNNLRKQKYVFSNHELDGEKIIQHTLYGLTSEEDRRRGNHFSEGDLVKMSVFGVQKFKENKDRRQLWCKITGFVKKVVFNESSVDKICIHNQEMGKLRKNGSISVKLTVRVRSRSFIPDSKVLVEMESVSSIITTLRQFQALSYLPKSLLYKDLLYPRVCDTYCDRTVGSSVTLSKENYNESEFAAIKTCVNIIQQKGARVCLIQSPPGTRKSHTIIGIIKNIIQVLNGRCRICLCAPSQAAVDLLVRRLLNANKNAGSSREIKIVRLGKKSSVHSEVQFLCLDTLTQNTFLKAQQVPQSLLGEMKALETNISALKKGLDVNKDALQKQKMMTDLKKLEQDKKKLGSIYKDKPAADPHHKEWQIQQQYLLRNAHVVAGTLIDISSSVMNACFPQTNKEPAFDCVIVDEAAQAIELDTLIPLQYGVTKLILVGDPEQLPPTVLSPIAVENKLKMSLFERLESHFHHTAVKPVIVLNIQYKMDPEIAMFPNNYIYAGKINNDISVSNRNQYPLVPYLLYDITEGKELFSQGCRSMSNLMEATFTTELCNFIVTESCVSQRVIGIIAPDAKQKMEIRKQLETRGLDIKVSTVDGFQDCEKHIIIMFCVGANMSGTVGFVGNRNWMNLCLTRAQYAMYIVANFDSLESSDEWKAVIVDAKQRNKIVTVERHSITAAIKMCLKQKES